MRDPERIDRIINKLRKYWLIYPDLRLGQIIVNASGTNDPFYVEDDEMENGINKLFNIEKSIDILMNKELK